MSKKEFWDTLRLPPFPVTADVTRRALKAECELYLEKFVEQHVICEYKVVCDDKNNPIDIIDQNRLQLDIFLRKSRTADIDYAITLS